MDFARWTEQYSVGDPLMDAYHHVFFKTLEDLSQQLEALSPEALADRLAFLLSYAAMHFDSEEQLMREVGFPGLEAHRELHGAFRARLAALQDRYLAQPSATAARELLDLSEAWLRDHILGEDMKYRPFLRR